ncbi:hypothetical protein PGT21_018908 [Puccinia graminis f. sp. tritici]|uniref:Uncharacterized protein n=1 Tax=Puccinia graminis f. sp. tritici TaxID=56615 RepID=A0A5B0LNB9_PUCGR|nr:hypothetical protein PGT21_018908 [Puccinia graminis f. sp. tritici]
MVLNLTLLQALVCRSSLNLQGSNNMDVRGCERITGMINEGTAGTFIYRVPGMERRGAGSRHGPGRSPPLCGNLDSGGGNGSVKDKCDDYEV